jgi:hypothetical protein
MVPLNPTITHAGLALILSASGAGSQLALTHVAFGSAKYDPDGKELALVNEVARYPIGAGGKASPTSIQVGVTMTNQDALGRVIGDQWIGEIGFYSGPTLFAVWSRSDKFLFHKSTEYEVPLAYTLDVSILPADRVTVTVSLGSAAMQEMLFQHERQADPHPQYVTAERLAKAGVNKWAENFFNYAN